MEKILVIRRNNLGDAVCVLPWLQGLKLERPDLHIDVVTNPYAQVVFNRSHAVTKTIAIPETHHGIALGVLWHPQFRKLCGGERYDCVINASDCFSEKASIMAYFANGKYKIGPVSGKKKLVDRVWDMPVSLPVSTHGMHQVRRIEYVGAKGGLVVKSLPEPIIKNNSICAQGFITLCPTVRRKQSRWNDVYWLRLERELLTYGCTAAWVGHKPAGASGMLLKTESVDDFFDVIGASEMVICSEGGTSHVAPALGVATIVLSGVSIRNTWAPWSKHAVVLEQPGMVDAITEAEVMRQVRSWMENKVFVEVECAFLNHQIQ